MTDPNDWEPRELGVEFSPSLNRWRYAHTKELIPEEVPVVTFLTYDLDFCEWMREIYANPSNRDRNKGDEYCVAFLDHRITCLKAQTLISQ